MAAAVTNVYLHSVRSKHRTQDEHRPFRLTPARVQDIRDVARGVEESDVGVCCSYLVDSASGEGADYDEHALNALERYADRSVDFEPTAYDDIGHTVKAVPVVAMWRRRLHRTRRAFALLRNEGDHYSASALYAAHGYPDGLARTLIDEMGERLHDCPIASLARYTDVVEAHRLAMAHDETKQSKFLAAFDRTRMSDEPSLANLVDLGLRRRVFEWAERVITSGDALRDALAVFAEPVPQKMAGENPILFEQRKAARKERKDAHDSKRSAFLLQVKIEATRILARAERAWHDAWLRCL